MRARGINMAQMRAAHFLFDFFSPCGSVGLGRTQAAIPSVKGAAASTPSLRKWTTPCRATQIRLSLAVVTHRFCGCAPVGLRLQTLPIAARNARAAHRSTGTGRVRAITAQPALFHAHLPRPAPLRLPAPLSVRAVCDTPLPITGACSAPLQKGHSC